MARQRAPAPAATRAPSRARPRRLRTCRGEDALRFTAPRKYLSSLCVRLSISSRTLPRASTPPAGAEPTTTAPTNHAPPPPHPEKETRRGPAAKATARLLLLLRLLRKPGFSGGVVCVVASPCRGGDAYERGSPVDTLMGEVPLSTLLCARYPCRHSYERGTPVDTLMSEVPL